MSDREPAKKKIKKKGTGKQGYLCELGLFGYLDPKWLWRLMGGGCVHGLVRTAEHQFQQEQGRGGGGGGGRPTVRL